MICEYDIQWLWSESYIHIEKAGWTSDQWKIQQYIVHTCTQEFCLGKWVSLSDLDEAKKW